MLLNMSGHQRAGATVYGVTFVVNVLLNFALIPHYGLYGAAIATTLAMIFETVTLAVVVKRQLGLFLFFSFLGPLAPCAVPTRTEAEHP